VRDPYRVQNRNIFEYVEVIICEWFEAIMTHLGFRVYATPSLLLLTLLEKEVNMRLL